MKGSKNRKWIVTWLCLLMIAVIIVGTGTALAADKVKIPENGKINYYVPLSGETVSVTLTGAYSSVVLQGKPTWVSSSKNGATFTLTIGKNTTNTTRKGSVVFRDGNKSWTLNLTQDASVTVKFYDSKGLSATQTYAVGAKFGSFPKSPTREGYTFAGWYTAGNGGNKVTTGTVVSSSHTSLYAHWTANKYTVTFNSNGGSSVSKKTVTFDGTYGTLAKPTRTGYTFDDWFTSLKGGNRKQSSSKVTTASNHTLYAHWIANKYKVTFDSTGGSTVKDKTVTFDGTYGTLTTPTKSGYKFLGWYTAKSGGTQISEKTKVTIASDQKLYAHWAIGYCKITFNVNGGNGQSQLQAITVQYGTKIGDQLSKRKPGAQKYTHFTGWYDAKTGGKKYGNDAVAPNKDALTLYAQWAPDQYYVSFNNNAANGVTGTMKPLTCDVGKSYKLPANTLKRQGFTFIGWNTKSDGSGKTYADGATISNLTTTHGGRITLYAIWKSNKTMVVSFDVNGGDAKSYKPITVKHLEAYGNLPNPTRTNYEFLGWYTAKEEGKGKKVSADTIVKQTTNHTLYAHWYRGNYDDVKYTYTTEDTKGKVHEVTLSDLSINFKEFFKSSYLDHKELMKASLKTAMAAFDAKEANKDAAREKNIKALMKSLGFDKDIEAGKAVFNYGKPDFDTIGFAIASRKIVDMDTGKTATLILIAIRGAGYEKEWGGNFRVYNPNGSNLNHHGFNLAADKVVSKLKDYLEANKNNFEETIKFWVVGYSRAAATTNLVCSKIINRGTDWPLTKENTSSKDVFGFGFETPRCTTDSGCHAEKYNGIKSLINPIDFVPMVAMNNSADWKYDRYGITYSIPLDDSSKAFTDMKDRYEEILITYNRKNELNQRVATTGGAKAQNALLSSAFLGLAVDTVNPKAYYESGIQDVLIPAMAMLMNLSDAENTVTSYNAFAACCTQKINSAFDPVKGTYVTKILLNPLMMRVVSYMPFIIKYAHYPELCLAWLTSYKGTFKKLTK